MLILVFFLTFPFKIHLFLLPEIRNGKRNMPNVRTCLEMKEVFKDFWWKRRNCVCFPSMCVSFKDESRRFRIQFAANALSTSQESCSDFVKNISKYIYVKTIDSDADNASQASQSMLVDQSQTQLGSSMEYEYSIPIKNEKPPNKITDAQIFATKSVRQIASVRLSFFFEVF